MSLNKARILDWRKLSQTSSSLLMITSSRRLISSVLRCHLWVRTVSTSFRLSSSWNTIRSVTALSVEWLLTSIYLLEWSRWPGDQTRFDEEVVRSCSGSDSAIWHRGGSKNSVMTDYWKWYHENRDPFPVHGFCDKYQPPLLLHRLEMVPYFEGLELDFFDKSSLMSGFYSRKWVKLAAESAVIVMFFINPIVDSKTFLVLPNVWLLHSVKNKHNRNRRKITATEPISNDITLMFKLLISGRPTVPLSWAMSCSGL